MNLTTMINNMLRSGIFLFLFMLGARVLPAADHVQEALTALYLEGHNAMLSYPPSQKFGADLAVKLSNLKKNSVINKADIQDYQALFLLRQAYLDGRSTGVPGEPKQRRYYGHDKIYYVDAPPILDDQLGNQLVMRMHKFFIPMLKVDLKDFNASFVELDHDHLFAVYRNFGLLNL